MNRKNMMNEVNRLLRRRSGGELPHSDLPPTGVEGVDMVHREYDDDEDEGAKDA